MQELLIVFEKIMVVFLVILVGWLAHRWHYLTEAFIGSISRFTVDIALPALIFTQMLRTIDGETLRANWYIPLVGATVIGLGFLVGGASAAIFNISQARPTFIFLIGMANWVYLPLPIAEGLYGEAGVRVVLLCNVGATFLLWTLGVWILRGGRFDWHSLRTVLTNPGLLATGVGAIVALVFPISQHLELMKPTADTALPLTVVMSAVQAIGMVGSLTIPLSLLVTGAQLGGLRLSHRHATPTLPLSVAARLVVVPVIVLALCWALRQTGITLPAVTSTVVFIIAAMPAAVSCSIFAERFQGDTSLAARGIFYSTLFSIATVPALFFIVQRLLQR